MNKNLVSGQYVFRLRRNRLVYVGNFDGLYQHQDDPWGQSGNADRLRAYYVFSRLNLADALNRHCPKGKLLEVGCGLGYAADSLAHSNRSWRITGLDISPTAVEKARLMFPHLRFKTGNAIEALPAERFDAIVLNQILWYVLKNLKQVLSNCHDSLKRHGVLAISTAFLREQKYGKEIVDGFNGLLSYVAKQREFQLIEASYDDSLRFLHHDGLVLLRRR